MLDERISNVPGPESPRASATAARLTESVIREMTRLALEHDAINLAQGFPDFPAAVSANAAQQLLPVVYSAIPVLRQLPHTQSAAGSPFLWRAAECQPADA